MNNRQRLNRRISVLLFFVVFLCSDFKRLFSLFFVYCIPRLILCSSGWFSCYFQLYLPCLNQQHYWLRALSTPYCNECNMFCSKIDRNQNFLWCYRFDLQYVRIFFWCEQNTPHTKYNATKCRTVQIHWYIWLQKIARLHVPNRKTHCKWESDDLFIDSIEKYLCRKFVCLPPTYVYHQFLLVYIVAVARNRQNFAHVQHAHRPNFLYGRRIVKESKAHMEHVLIASNLSPIRAHNWMIHCCCFLLLLIFTFVIYSWESRGHHADRKGIWHVNACCSCANSCEAKKRAVLQIIQFCFHSHWRIV